MPSSRRPPAHAAGSGTAVAETVRSPAACEKLKWYPKLSPDQIPAVLLSVTMLESRETNTEVKSA